MEEARTEGVGGSQEKPKSCKIREFLVKWQGKSYWKCSWVSELRVSGATNSYLLYSLRCTNWLAHLTGWMFWLKVRICVRAYMYVHVFGLAQQCTCISFMYMCTYNDESICDLIWNGQCSKHVQCIIVYAIQMNVLVWSHGCSFAVLLHFTYFTFAPKTYIFQLDVFQPITLRAYVRKHNMEKEPHSDLAHHIQRRYKRRSTASHVDEKLEEQEMTLLKAGVKQTWLQIHRVINKRSVPLCAWWIMHL